MSLETLHLLLRVAIAAVAVGVVLEEWDDALRHLRQGNWRPFLPKLGFILVALGVAAEFPLDIAITSSEVQTQTAAEDEIRDLRKANLELEKRLAARGLSDEQVANLRKRLATSSGPEFMAIPYWDDKESMDIANRIADTLIGAGWKLHNPEHGEQLVGVVAGISISADSEAPQEVRDAAKELAAALVDSSLEAISQESSNSYSKSMIVVKIGIKP